MELRCLCTVTTGTASNFIEKAAFLTAGFSLPLPTMEVVYPIQVQPGLREPFFQLSWVGATIKQLVRSQVFHLLFCLRNVPIQSLEGW